MKDESCKICSGKPTWIRQRMRQNVPDQTDSGRSWCRTLGNRDSSRSAASMHTWLGRVSGNNALGVGIGRLCGSGHLQTLAQSCWIKNHDLKFEQNSMKLRFVRHYTLRLRSLRNNIFYSDHLAWYPHAVNSTKPFFKLFKMANEMVTSLKQFWQFFTYS